MDEKTTIAAKPLTAREQIKLAARRLFAERGFDGVTVSEIVEASGQKNHGALSYYFSTKEALVRELVVDGAKLIDTRRNAFLDRLEAAGGPKDIRDVVEVLVYPSINLAEETETAEDSYIRFIALLGMSHREFFMEAVENRWNSGYLRCLAHLRRLMPPMPVAAKNQRFIFLRAFLTSVIAAREAALADRSQPHPMWRSEATLHHFIGLLTVMLPAPLDEALTGGSWDMGGEPLSIVGSVGMILD